jgi:hypothetical protein
LRLCRIGKGYAAVTFAWQSERAINPLLPTSDPRLEDRVGDNLDKFDITESESLLFGTNFGIGTDIHTGPNGNLFVVSLSNGAIYEIFRRN